MIVAVLRQVILTGAAFVQTVGIGAGLAAWQSGFKAIAGPFNAKDVTDHFIPVDKKLAKEWIDALFAVGSPTWYSGDELATIGMPVGGIGAGQVYLTGDGRLEYWDIFNQTTDTGVGQVNYKRGRKPTEIARGTNFEAAPTISQGTALRINWEGKTEVRTLDAEGFPEVRFCGEYPLGRVEYRDSPVAGGDYAGSLLAVYSLECGGLRIAGHDSQLHRQATPAQQASRSRC